MSDVGAFGKFCVTYSWWGLAAIVLLATISPRCIRALKSSERTKFRVEWIARSSHNAFFFLATLILLSQATSIGGLNKALGELYAYAASGGDPSIKINPEEVKALWKLTARASRSGVVALACTGIGCWLQVRWLKQRDLLLTTEEYPYTVDTSVLS